MSEHTKGPWHVVKTGEGIYEVRCENPNKLPIVTVDHHRDGHEPTRTVTAPANAHLIAAAPELLAALKAIFSENLFYHRAGDEKVFREANEAIAKVEGRA